jgi:hypothetical protein
MRGERQAPPRTGTLTEAGNRYRDPWFRHRRHATGQGLRPFRRCAGGGWAVVGRDRRPCRHAGRAAGGTTVKGSEKAWRVARPRSPKVDAERSRSIAARLVLTDEPAVLFGRWSPTTAVVAGGGL